MTLLASNTIELPDIWVTSDTHWFHSAIIDFADRPDDHNELMVRNWVELVQPGDKLLHLGDLVMGSTKRFDTEVAPYLTGEKHLLRGNHDHRKIGWYRKRGFYNADRPAVTNYRGYRIHFSHFPQPKIVKRDLMAINVHGHIHENSSPHSRCLNVCVEQTDYKPVWIKDLLDNKIESLYANLPVRDASRTA